MSLLAIFIVIISSIYLFLRYIFSYWSRKGFAYLKPTIPLGNLKPLFKREKSFGLLMYELHKNSKESFLGIYLLFRPALLVRDTNFVKKILLDNNSHFYDRGIYVNEGVDPWSETIFALEGQKWKNLRQKLTSAFTSGKLKLMSCTIEEIGDRMVDYLVKNGTPDNMVDVKEIASRFSLDVIASIIFGLEIDCISNPEHEFRLIVDRINSPKMLDNLKASMAFLVPEVLKLFRTTLMAKDVRDFMLGIVEQTIYFRETNNVERKDFMQLLIQLRNSGQVSQDNDWSIKASSNDAKTMTVEQLAAQVFLFYIAGFDTTSSTIAFCLYELSQNEEILGKLRENIRSTLKRHNGELNYESILDMKYLENCILETLRKYPTLPLLNRICTKRYHVPDSELVVEKGTPIIISLMGIQRDPENFKDPLKFLPERFEDKDFIENAYLPFGDGHRTCIGLRMGKLTAKIGIVKLLMNFNLHNEGADEIEFDNFAVTLVPKGGVKVKLMRKN